jgi:uncharacterized protein
VPVRSQVVLLDGNVLVALADSVHVHHTAARSWFAGSELAFATCPITQGTLLRMLLRLGAAADLQQAMEALAGFTGHPRHRFWADHLPYEQVLLRGVQSHGQITDAYLAALARHHGGRLATFDKGLAALHADVALRIEAGHPAPGQP